MRLAVRAGAEIDPVELKATPDRDVVVSVKADGIIIGGMTYSLDPDRAEPLPQGDPSDEYGYTDKAHREHAARGMLRCLDLPDAKVANVRLRNVSVEIELGD